MCGIVGIIGREPVAGQLVDALKRLEYRGYDSAGVATLEARRADAPPRRGQARQSRDAAAAASRSAAPSASATPAGRRTASRPRATPIRTPPTRVAVVHNGIIENFRELREELEPRARRFAAETDTEVDRASGHRRDERRARRRSRRSQAALPRLRGAFALAFLFDGEDDLLIGARKGSPLAVGYGDGEMYLGSDAIALAPFTDAPQLSRGRRLGGGDAARASRSATPTARMVERAVHQVERLGVPGRQGQPPPFHGEGNPRAARGRRPHARALSRHGRPSGCRCR